MLVISLQEFAVEAENLGLPLIPREIIEGFLERTRPREVLTEITARDALATAAACSQDYLSPCRYTNE